MTVITMPDGVAVDFGNMPPEQIKSLIQKKFPNLGKPPISTGEDVARSALTGLGEGATQSVGLLGDVQSLADQAGTWIGDQLGFKRLTPEQQARLDNPFGMPDISAPTTAEIEQATGFDQVKHEPQTTAGKYARTGASFVSPTLPAALVRGGVKEGVKVATKYGLAPGLASEAAGQATEGTPYEPIARIGGAVLGAGGAASLLKGKKPPAGPTIDDLTQEAKTLYDSAKQRGVLVSHASSDNAIDDLTRKVQAFGPFDPQLTPDSFRVVQRLHNDFKGTSLDLEDVGTIRELIGTAAGATRKEDRQAAMILKNAFDDYTKGLTSADVLSGDPQAAMNDIIKARSLWHRMEKATTIKTIVDNVERQVRSGKRVNRAAAYQSAFETLAKNKKAMRQFNADETNAIESIVDGADSITKFLSRLAPAGYLSTVLSPGIGATVGGAILGPVGAAIGGVGVPAIGGVARAAAVKNVTGKADALSKAILTGTKPVMPKGSALPAVAPWYGAKELQREPNGGIKRDRNGVPILDERGRYIPAA